MAGAGSLRMLLRYKLQESVGIRGWSWFSSDAVVLQFAGIRGHPWLERVLSGWLLINLLQVLLQ